MEIPLNTANNYWNLMKYLSNDVKLELIARLSNSLVGKTKNQPIPASKFYGVWSDSDFKGSSELGRQMGCHGKDEHLSDLQAAVNILPIIDVLNLFASEKARLRIMGTPADDNFDLLRQKTYRHDYSNICKLSKQCNRIRVPKLLTSQKDFHTTKLGEKQSLHSRYSVRNNQLFFFLPIMNKQMADKLKKELKMEP